MRALFEIHQLRFRKILFLDHLVLHEGEVTALVGQSGSGKTTLLRMLNLLSSPEEGSVSYRGRDLEQWDAVSLRREVVMLQQQPLMFPGTVRENLLSGLRFSEKEAASDATLRQMLETVHLNKALSEDTSKFSGGEKQRLALGRVLLLNPRVLLLDEPSSALDAPTAHATIRDTVRAAQERHITVIMVTHDAPLAEEFADRILTMQAGRLISDVRPDDREGA